MPHFGTPGASGVLRIGLFKTDLREGYHIPFLSSPPLSLVPAHLPSYSPSSIRGQALAAEIAALLEKGAIELAPPTPGYYSRVFRFSRLRALGG